MKSIYLVDISSFIFRAFFAIRPLSTPSGQPTNAIYGVLTMMAKLLREKKPDGVVFCFDSKTPSFRANLDTEYKANRTEMPDDLSKQMDFITQIPFYLGLPSYAVQGMEADDLIGTLATKACSQGYKVFITSSDKDFAQLVNDCVFMYDTMKENVMGAPGVVEKFGVRPDQFCDYLAMVGDASDNIAGLAGVGPKTAAKLLQDYGTIDGIYENIDQLKPAVQEKFRSGRDRLNLSRKLVEIKKDIDIDLPEKFFHPPPKEEFLKFLGDMQFRSMENLFRDHLSRGEVQDSRELEGALAVGPFVEPAKKPIVRILTPEERARLQGEMAGAPPAPAVVSLDYQIEIERLNFLEALEPGHEISCFRTKDLFLLWSKHEKRAVAFGRDELSRAGVAQLSKLLNTKQFLWSGFDVKNFWHAVGLEKSATVTNDLLLAAYVVSSGEKLDWPTLSLKYLDEMGAELVIASDENEIKRVISQYLRMEAKLGDCVRQSDQTEILNAYELPLLGVLYSMEKAGVAVDRGILKAQSDEITVELADIQKEIYELAGQEFNVLSPKQLGAILFEKMQLPTGKKTKTGFSTDTDVLSKLKALHPIAGRILEFRELSKLKSTYIDSLPELCDEGGRIHTTFNQALTTTGRLSSSQPNLQNIPIRTPRGARVRQAFVAHGNCELLSVDYSQIELRVLAHFSDDEGLRHAFTNNLDVHQATASEVFAVPLDTVTPEQRRIAKAVNFGIAYGQGAFGLAEVLEIGRSEAQDIIKRYFGKFPKVREYIDDTLRAASLTGYVETLAKRRRIIPELKSSNQMMKRMGERAAINMPIQGTAADIVKKAMIEVSPLISSKMILQVHDELIFEGSREALEKEAPIIQKTMETATILKVPLVVQLGFGKNWDQAH